MLTAPPPAPSSPAPPAHPAGLLDAAPRAARLTRPRWGDPRALVGVLLVLGSVVLGARVLAAADDTVPVWTVSRPLAPGAVLAPGDLERRDVSLGALAPGYVTGAEPLGYALRRSVAPGELLPAAALGRPGEDRPLRAVTVPVAAGHLAPDLAAGQQVDVYVTPGRDRAAAAPTGAATRLVLRGVTVLQREVEGAEGDEAVVLQVGADQVVTLLAAARSGALDLVLVPDPLAAEPAP